MLQLDHFQIAIPEGGEVKARAFWCGILGLDELEKPQGLRGRGGMWLGLDGLELHLGVEPGFTPAKKAHPGFATGDLDGVAGRLTKAGYPVIWDNEIKNRRRFFSADPFGNRLEFMQKD